MSSMIVMLMLFLLVIVIISDMMVRKVRMPMFRGLGGWVAPAGVLGAEVGYDGD